MLFFTKKQKIKTIDTIRLSVLLVVFVLVCLGVVVHFQNQKAAIRDARRIADLQQMQTVLNYHFELFEAYPVAEDFVCFNTLSDSLTTVVPWIVVLPADPNKGNLAHNSAQACYNYISADGTGYKIRTALENNMFSMEHDGGSSDEWYELYTLNAQTW